MAQTQVTNYFLVTRKDREKLPAKRLKIDTTHTECNSYQNVTLDETIQPVQTRVSKRIKISESLKTPAKLHKRLSQSKLKIDLQTSQDIRNYTFLRKENSADLKPDNQNGPIVDNDNFQGIATTLVDDHKLLTTPIPKPSVNESLSSNPSDTNSVSRISKRSRRLLQTHETLSEDTSNSKCDLKNISGSKSCRRRLELQSDSNTDLIANPNNLIKHGPEYLRERLAKCNKVSRAQLLETFTQITAQKKKLKEFQDNKEKEQAENADKIQKESTVSLPSYQRFNALASSQAATLILPYKYRVLEEVFRSSDQIVSLLHNRSEICTFIKLKTAVQEMMRKNFQLHHLAQIKTVYPSAYFLRQEKNIPCFGNKKSSDYQLCIYANLYTENNVMLTDNRKEFLEDISHSFNILMNPSKLRERKALFHNNLVDIVKKHHEIFLSTLVPPVMNPEHIVRWHPKFCIDEVVDILPSSLPQPPFVLKYNTAQDVLNNTKDRMNEKVRKALEMVAKKSAKEENSKEIQIARKSEKEGNSKEIKIDTVLNSPSALKGVSSDLIERIRQKEAAKMEKIMTRNPADEKKLLMMSRLPEFVRIIRNFFISEKKAAISMVATIKMLASSSSSNLATEEIKSHIRMIVEYLPEWLSVVIIRKVAFLKIDRNMDINKVCDQLKQNLKERL